MRAWRLARSVPKTTVNAELYFRWICFWFVCRASSDGFLTFATVDIDAVVDIDADADVDVDAK